MANITDEKMNGLQFSDLNSDKPSETSNVGKPSETSNIDKPSESSNVNRPFILLCDKYFDKLMTTLNEAVKIMEKKENENINVCYIPIDMAEKIIISYKNGDVNIEKEYTIDTAHYAPRKKYFTYDEHGNSSYVKPWTYRDWTIWKRCHISQPFRRAQTEMKKRGYYLVDLSDPMVDNKTHVYLYKNKYLLPPFAQLWHRLNMIPDLFS